MNNEKIKKELEKKYKQVCKLNDGNYMVSTKAKDEVNEVNYFAHTNIDEVYGMEGNWGLVDQFGNIIIEFQYVYPFIECGDNYQVMLPEGILKINDKDTIITLKHGLLDKKGNVVIPIRYLYMEVMDNTGTYFRVFDEGLGKSGVLDKDNNIIVPFEYDFIQASPDYALMTHTEYCSIYPDNIYQVKISNNDLYGIYDLNLKKEIIKPKYKFLTIKGYNKFAISDDFFESDTLINEKEEIISNNINA